MTVRLVLSTIPLMLFVSALAGAASVPLARDLDRGAESFSLRLPTLELLRQVPEYRAEGRLLLRALVDGVIREERLDVLEIVELGCRASLRRLILRLDHLDGLLPRPVGRVLIAFFCDLF